LPSELFCHLLTWFLCQEGCAWISRIREQGQQKAERAKNKTDKGAWIKEG